MVRVTVYVSIGWLAADTQCDCRKYPLLALRSRISRVEVVDATLHHDWRQMELHVYVRIRIHMSTVDRLIRMTFDIMYRHQIAHITSIAWSESILYAAAAANSKWRHCAVALLNKTRNRLNEYAQYVFVVDLTGFDRIYLSGHLN